MRPDAGTATVAGCDLLADPAGVRRAISLTGQYAAVDDMLSGDENLRMMARLLRLRPRDAADRSAELLAEFGLARAYQASAMSGLTMTGTPGGTPGYMPPEQVMDFRNARPASDQYAAAATLIHRIESATEAA